MSYRLESQSSFNVFFSSYKYSCQLLIVFTQTTSGTYAFTSIIGTDNHMQPYPVSHFYQIYLCEVFPRIVSYFVRLFLSQIWTYLILIHELRWLRTSWKIASNVISHTWYYKKNTNNEKLKQKDTVAQLVNQYKLVQKPIEKYIAYF